jgi:hypothetical protein
MSLWLANEWQSKGSTIRSRYKNQVAGLRSPVGTNFVPIPAGGRSEDRSFTATVRAAEAVTEIAGAILSVVRLHSSGKSRSPVTNIWQFNPKLKSGSSGDPLPHLWGLTI